MSCPSFGSHTAESLVQPVRRRMTPPGVWRSRMLPNRRQASRRSTWAAQEPECYAVAIVRADSGLVAVEGPGPQVSARAVFLVTVTPLDQRRANVKVTGELDLATVPFLTDLLDREFAVGARDLVIDVTDLSFCSCAGLAGLLASRHRLAAAGGTLTLTGCEGWVGRLLRLTDRVGGTSELPAAASEQIKALSAHRAVTAAWGGDLSRGAGPAAESLAAHRTPSTPRRRAGNGVVSTNGGADVEFVAGRHRYNNAGPDVYWPDDASPARDRTR